ncbi:peptide ABC transporter substrate-binding protein [Aliidongia dinghuensis]|uniref:Peptide ABC transporter substrate-binding protein n=1 Tax=Aliidongia dinghuensis TaxID=1867774 RepID=A0A8J3E3T1_9PROT|nr:peptide ABC transporter substrate-binding protein [Aliidongia dinghuensis]GGF08986.1 peptide ABC transporter substrate-binding protein [Aliidongia dinghuensis]
MDRRTCLAAALLCLFSLPAYADHVLHRPLEVEPDSLDPVKTTSTVADAIESDLFEGLVRLDPQGNIVPGVAERWERAADGVTYTFHLRPDARWSNGDPLTAADFVYAWRRGVDPATAATSLHALTDLVHGRDILAGKGMDPVALGVEAVDALTLRAVTAAPTPLFLAHCALRDAYPAHRATIERWGRAWTQPEHMVSNGPFVLKSWVPHGETVLRRSETYWDRASIKLDEVDDLAADDGEVALKRVLAGELDYAEVPTRELASVRADHAALLHIGRGTRIHNLAFNTATGPFAGNKPLRQALALTFDAGVVVDKLQKRGQQIAYNWVPPTIADYTPQRMFYAGMTMEQRVALARKLYAEAGYGPGRPLQLTVNYPTNEDVKAELLAAAQMWKAALGVEVTLESEEFQVYLQRVKRGDDQMSVLGWSETVRDPSLFLERFRTGGFGNYFQYANPAVDALLDAGGQTMEAAKRRSLYEQAERIIDDDVPGIPSYFNSIVMAVNPRLEGWVDDEQYPQSRWLSLKD